MLGSIEQVSLNMGPIRRGFDLDERASLQGWLAFHRRLLVDQADGLTDDQARFRHAPSAFSIMGLIRHLAEGERWWFRIAFAGEVIDNQWSTPDDPARCFNPTSDDTLAEAIAAYRAAWTVADEIVAASRDLDQLSTGSPPELGGFQFPLRWVLTHMIEERARHNGHADLIREAIDGRVGGA